MRLGCAAWVFKGLNKFMKIKRLVLSPHLGLPLESNPLETMFLSTGLIPNLLICSLQQSLRIKTKRAVDTVFRKTSPAMG